MICPCPQNIEVHLEASPDCDTCRGLEDARDGRVYLVCGECGRKLYDADATARHDAYETANARYMVLDHALRAEPDPLRRLELQTLQDIAFAEAQRLRALL